MAFLFVFLMSILGFGIAFHSLFPDRSEFAGSGTTFLALFNAALGDHNFRCVCRAHTAYCGDFYIAQAGAHWTSAHPN